MNIKDTRLFQKFRRFAQGVHYKFIFTFVIMWGICFSGCRSGGNSICYQGENGILSVRKEDSSIIAITVALLDKGSLNEELKIEWNDEVYAVNEFVGKIPPNNEFDASGEECSWGSCSNGRWKNGTRALSYLSTVFWFRDEDLIGFQILSAASKREGIKLYLDGENVLEMEREVLLKFFGDSILEKEYYSKY